MRVRSLLTIGVLLGALSSAFGQSVSSETKDKVLLSMQNTIQRQAFVPGIDFTQWPAFLAKRQTEVDSQIAPISAIGARHNIPCPTIDRLVAMIHEVEAGTRPMVDNTLLELAA